MYRVGAVCECSSRSHDTNFGWKKSGSYSGRIRFSNISVSKYLFYVIRSIINDRLLWNHYKTVKISQGAGGLRLLQDLSTYRDASRLFNNKVFILSDTFILFFYAY